MVLTLAERHNSPDKHRRMGFRPAIENSPLVLIEETSSVQPGRKEKNHCQKGS